MAAKKKSTAKKKAPAKPKAAPKSEAAATEAPKIFNTGVNDEDKALFIGTHLPNIKTLRARLNTANSNLRSGYKSAKAHGFSKQDFDYAVQLETAELEAKTKARIARNLVIAKMVGSALGAQLDMFLEPDRTPATDRAYEEGQSASMRGEPAKPVYAPATEQHAQYMKGFHDDQAKRVKGGIKKMDPAKDRGANNGKPDKAPAKAEPAQATEVTSGVPLSRSAFLQQQQAAAKAAAPNASGGNADELEEQEEESAFKKREPAIH